MFCDQTKLILTAGIGGKGVVAFRREKFVERGGPSGGDGGNGGNLFLKVNTALNSLIHLHTYKRFTAEHGEQGHGQNKHGANAEDLYLEVPIGTIVRQIFRDEEDEIIQKKQIADLSSPNKSLLVAKGGRGGYGNAHFVSSVRQAPKFAEIGEDGESIEVELELKLVADIGIIGIPSTGKSTLISVLSNAKPKIAAYHFTTLTPHLGVAKIADDKSYVIADIPGLIQGAHKGKGLGIAFLKHIQRCRFLVHLIDPIQEDLSEEALDSDPSISNFHLINQELENFSEDLAHKKQIVVFNKSDVISEERQQELMEKLKKECAKDERFHLYPDLVSAATTQGITDLKNWLFHKLEEMKADEPEVSFFQTEEDESKDEEKEVTHILYTPHLDDPKYYSVEQSEENTFIVTGERITQIVNMTDFNNREAILRVRDVLKKMGIDKQLKKAGIKDGDTVKIGNHVLEHNSDPF
jgi:GTP-binding protein